ncbi:hypothetical protein K504DRAFT_235617 [Pleomassaria siparia CBS 279.74]|uniref:Secreted protein n=1 Tax=Pleomassaria siparia CBS 279.74 TaxID=1314801 RepID=A0A6G1KEA5_9PLEO|nr:hypothetical protein K504DRAFT_235617 [Pleomassaria siparia CBS 279.74]
MRDDYSFPFLALAWLGLAAEGAVERTRVTLSTVSSSLPSLPLSRGGSGGGGVAAWRFLPLQSCIICKTVGRVCLVLLARIGSYVEGEPNERAIDKKKRATYVKPPIQYNN